MEVVVAQQTALFFQACALGFVLGLCLEPFRVSRLMIKTGAVAVFFQDILYWSFCAVCTFLFILTVNSGQLRIFLVAGIVIGMIVYFLTLGALVMRASRAIVAFIRRVLRVVNRVLILPIVGVHDKIKKKTGKAINKLRARNKKIQNNVNYRLKQHRVLLYNLIHTPKLQDSADNSENRGHSGYENKRHKKEQDTTNH
ncbi:MAG: spore cortex biosynthesis protein YabQ [Acetanaerobacterium sp.]